jgi:hypothetical protein
MSGWYAALSLWAVALPTMYESYEYILVENKGELSNMDKKSLFVFAGLWPAIELVILLINLTEGKNNND